MSPTPGWRGRELLPVDKGPPERLLPVDERQRRLMGIMTYDGDLDDRKVSLSGVPQDRRPGILVLVERPTRTSS